MASSNHIKNIAMVGVGGNAGSYIAQSLLASKRFNLTALTRPGSTSSVPSGCITKHIDYADPGSLVAALRGQDALIITMSVAAPPSQQEALIDAAAEAGVHWILPNDWGTDTSDEALVRDVPLYAGNLKAHAHIREKGCNFLSVICGFWYEWSLAIPHSYGFDFANKKVTFFDDGETPISTSTWPQVGKAVAALLSLPLKAEGGEREKSLEHFRNERVFVASFMASQKQMFESALRILGDKESDWEVSYEPAAERYEKAKEAMAQGDRAAFARFMYARGFYKDDNGNHEKRHGLANVILDVAMEDLDEATRAGIERSKVNTTGYNH